MCLCLTHLAVQQRLAQRWKLAVPPCKKRVPWKTDTQGTGSRVAGLQGQDHRGLRQTWEAGKGKEGFSSGGFQRDRDHQQRDFRLQASGTARQRSSVALRSHTDCGALLGQPQERNTGGGLP